MARMSERPEIHIDRDVARWVALGIGGVALLVFAIAMIVIPPPKFASPVSYISLGVAVLGIVGFILLDPDAIAQAITGRAGQQAVITVLLTIGFLAMIVVAYYILYQLSQQGKITPADLTEAQKYQLHDATIELLEGLEESVHVTGFYAQNDRASREEAERWLQQYARYSGDLLTYDFVDPDRNPGEATRLGGRQGILIFEQNDRTAEASFADESSLTGALLRVTLGEPVKAYVVSGHGERSIDDFADSGFSQARDLLDRSNYSLESLNLLEAGSVPEDAEVVIIPGPTAQFAQAEMAALTAYLNGGGSVLFLLDPGTGGGSLGNGVLAVDYSPDGSRLLTAGSDGTVRLWDATSSAVSELLVLRGHTSDVVDASFSPDGRRIVSAGADQTVRVWDAESGEEIGQLQGEIAGVWRVAFSPDGQTIASVGQDQVINVWDADTLEPAPYSPIPTVVPLFALAFSPDGSTLAAGGGRVQGSPNGEIFLYDLATGNSLADETLHTNVVDDLAFSTDGATLYSVAVDGTEGTLDVASGEGSIQTLYPDQGIYAVGIGGDGTVIFGLGDGSIHVRAPGASSADNDVVLAEHSAQIWDIAVSPDGTEFVSASRDGDARVWNLEDQATRLRITGHATGDPLLNYLSEQWGIQVNDDIVVDLWTAQEFDQLTPVITTFDATSSITQPLNDAQARVFMIYARTVQAATAPEGVTITPLAFTTPPISNQIASWGENDLEAVTLGDAQYNPEEDVAGPVAVAISAENAATGGRVIVIGDADFASNSGLQRTVYSNGSLVLDATNWLARTDQGIDLPPGDFSMATWDNPLPPIGLALIQISVTCLVPLAMIVIGAAVWFVRRRRR
jgi:WD40 repeat protein